MGREGIMRLLMLLNILIGRRGRRYISQDSTHNTTSNSTQPPFIHTTTTTTTNTPSDDLKNNTFGEKKTYITFPLREKNYPITRKKKTRKKINILFSKKKKIQKNLSPKSR